MAGTDQRRTTLATCELLLASCVTVWVRASPGEHMARVRRKATCDRWPAMRARWTTFWQA